MKIGIIRETKDPPDRRVPFTPEQCSELQVRHPDLEVLVQPSEIRCFRDEDYTAQGIPVSEDLTSCDLLLGVKEVSVNSLIEGKTYLFFSHTAKKQPHNRELLGEVIRKGIRLIDYEYLTGENGQRVVAFGRWAGVVGAYNGLRGYGIRSRAFELRPAYELDGLAELKKVTGTLSMPGVRIVLTGGGRVAGGATEVLEAAGIKEIDPAAYLEEEFREAVFTRLDPWHYTRRRGGAAFDFDHFLNHPGRYENAFIPYAMRSDIYVACHFWDPASPGLLTAADLKPGAVPVRVIADISCDVGGPIASTLRASTIAEPFYGYDRVKGEETGPFLEDAITVMAVDNLPGELPADASADFGTALLEQVIPELLGERDTGMLERACIAEGGRLTGRFDYLQAYLEGRE